MNKELKFMFRGSYFNVSILFLIGILAILNMAGCSSNGKDDSQINLELQSLENEIIITIDKGNKEKALQLLGELMHPSDEKWNEAPGEYSIFNTPSYSKYWTNRRNDLREKALAISLKEVTNVVEKIIPKNILQALSKSEDLIEKGKAFVAYVGTYLNNDGGITRLYNFKVAPDSKELEIYYQNNENGDVNIENFYLKEITASSNVTLINTKDSLDERILKIIEDAQSDNGYRIEDSSGSIYENFEM